MGGGGHRHHVSLSHVGGPGLSSVPSPHQELQSEGGDEKTKKGSEDDILRVVFVVRDSGERGVHSEQSAAHLYQRPDQAEVPCVHFLLDVDHTKPHAVGGQTRVAGDEAESHVVHSMFHFSTGDV